VFRGNTSYEEPNLGNNVLVNADVYYIEIYFYLLGVQVDDITPLRSSMMMFFVLVDVLLLILELDC
jgi:hypothetical protein